MSEEMNNVFLTLNKVNVNGHTEKKNTGRAVLTYLSWPWAWAEVKSRYPDASYEVIKNPDGLPYFADPRSGIMVYTKVTIGGVTHEMWLPVMDGANNAMKFEPYEVTTRFGTKPVAAATMFDVNKTVMRCLVKNLAMFGLGLYIYAGEDLPDGGDEGGEDKEKLTKMITEIDTLTRQQTDGMTRDEKIEFLQRVVQPVIGSLNYKTCKDTEKLAKLLNALRKAT